MLHVLKLSKVFAVAAALTLMLSTSPRSVADEKADAKKEKGSISGTVMGTDGKAASGVTVRLLSAADAQPGKADKAAGATNAGKALAADADKAADKPGKGKGARQAALDETSTNEKGEFTFKEVAAGEYFVAANQRGVGNARKKVTVKAGETAKVELALKEAKKAAK